MQTNPKKSRLRLVHRITLAILSMLLVVVALVAVSLYVSVERGFSRYVRAIEEARLAPAVRRLNALYLRDGSWAALAQQPQLFGPMLRAQHDDADDGNANPMPREERSRPRPAQPPGTQPPSAPPPAIDWSDDQPPLRPPLDQDGHRDPLELPPRVTLYDAWGRPVVGRGELSDAASRLRLTALGATVGWLGVRAITNYDDELDRDYIAQVRSQIVLIATVAMILGVLAGWLITRRLLRPIDALSAGARRLTAGDYNVRISIDQRDELGQLTHDFDALARTLASNEVSRRQWVADTSHELRTPLTILRAEVDSMLDGLQPLNQAALESLQAEIARLDRLVSDLDQLAQSDRGELELVCTPMEIAVALDESIATFRNRFKQRGLTLESTLGSIAATLIDGDRARLQQVFVNLLENSLRYTDAGGQLQISSVVVTDQLQLRFDDSAPGVANDHLMHLFDRFYRADPSRSRAFGGAGLGLAICERIIAAHGGTIRATPSPLGGVRMEIRLRCLSTNVTVSTSSSRTT